MPGVLQQVQVTTTPVRIASLLVSSDDAFLLVNPDILNQIFIGNDQASQPISIPPLGSLSLTQSSSHDIWVSTGGGNYTVQALVLPNGSQWTPSPAQVAAQINALGLAKDSSVVNVNNSLAFGTNPSIQTLGGAANRSVAQDMLNAHSGTTTEIAALLSSGVPGGSPGGIPLLRFTKQLGTATATVIPANGSIVTLVNATNINQPGYEFTGQVFMASGSGTVPFVRLTITWLDSLSGLTTSFKHYYLTCGNGAGNVLTFYLSGPCLGDQVNVFMTGLDPSVTASMQWLFNVTSHVFTHDQLSQTALAATAPNGFTNPGGDPAAGLLALAIPTVGPSSTTTRLAAAHSGPAVLQVDNPSTTNAILVALRDPGTIYQSSAGIRLGTLRMATSSSGSLNIILPYGPVAIDIINEGASNNVTPNVALITTDQ